MKLERNGTIVTRAADKGQRVDLAISSETPVERIFGTEVLRHTPDSVDLSRLGDGRHPLLLDHDHTNQIGVIERVWLDNDKFLRGTSRFSRADRAQEIQQDVADGVRSQVSVGYEILEVEEQVADGGRRTLGAEEFEREMREKYGTEFHRAGPYAHRARGESPPTYTVTRWRPFEVSIVSIAADPRVGVGRSQTLLALPTKPKGKPIMHSPQDVIPQTREQEIIALGDQYRKYVSIDDVSAAVRGGHTVDQFTQHILNKMESRHTSTADLHIGMGKADVQRYSIARAIVASITGDWRQAGLERDASEALSRMLGKPPTGFYVPYDVFQKRDFNVGTSIEAGNLVPTHFRDDLFTDVLRNNLVMIPLGLRVLQGLTGNIDIPTKTAAGAIGMATEIQALTETNPTTGKVSLAPKRFGGYVEYSKQALIQSGLALEPMLRDDLLASGAVKLQDQIINGAGTGAEIRGIRNVSGIGTVVGGANGAALAWSHVVALESACADSNAEPGQVAGYCLNTKTRGKSKNVQKATNLPFLWDGGPAPLNGYRVAITNTLPSNLTKGTSTTVCSSALFSSDWSMGVLALFGAPDVTIDPYSLATTGQVRITLNQFADFGVRQAACFAKMDDALTT